MNNSTTGQTAYQRRVWQQKKKKLNSENGSLPGNRPADLPQLRKSYTFI